MTKASILFRLPKLNGGGVSEHGSEISTPVASQGREQQLLDIARQADSDAAECAIADLMREFPDHSSDRWPQADQASVAETQA